MLTLIIILIFNLLGSIYATSIDGTSAFQQKTNHYVLRDTNTVTGLVRFADGFTILEDSNHGSAAYLDTCLSCSGGFDLQDTSTLILLGDLKLDSATTLTKGGKIFGHKRALMLSGDLTLAANKILHLDGNLIIDGQGHNIFLNEWSQIMLDSNATVTIQNATIRNKRNNPGWPSIALTTTHSKLTLSDVELALDSDFYVNSGQIFIHNDVAITGTSAFVWRSLGPCTIEPNSCLYFDNNTTFSYAPSTTDKNLIRMRDQSSTLHLNGCSLFTTHTGLQLTKGTVVFENKLQLDSTATNSLNNLTPLLTQSYGDTIFTVAWSPNGKYLAIGGYNPALFGGDASTKELQIYGFNGSTLTTITSQEYGYEILTLAWSPDGRYLAIGGKTPETFGSGPNTNELHIYKFDGNSLTPITSQDYGTGEEIYLFALTWSPDGKYLAIGGRGAATFGGQDNTNELQIYQFNGKALIAVTSQDIGADDASSVRTLSWSPDGAYLAVGGFVPTLFGGDANTNEIQIYRFNNNVLTPVTSQNYGNSDSYVFTASWSPDGRFLAIGGTLPTTFGGEASSNELQVYEFNGSSLSPITSQNFGEAIWGLCWSPDGRYIAIGGSTPARLKIYKLENNSLTLVDSQVYTNTVFGLSWAPDNKYLAVGGINGDNDLTIYTCNYVNETATQATTNGIVLGNKDQGSSDDTTLQLLGNTNINVNGILNFNNDTTQPTFANRDAHFVLQNSSSKLYLAPSSVLGWKDGSIIKNTSSVGEGDYNLQGYAGADSIIGYTEAPMSLVYSTSLAIKNLTQPVSIWETPVTYDSNTSVDSATLFKQGFIVENGATLTLNTPLPVYGDIDLGGDSTLQLDGNLILGPDAQFTAGGIINGNGHRLALSSNLAMPTAITRSPGSKRIKIQGDTIIDGRSNSLLFDLDSELVLDANASLTLVNIRLVRTANSETMLSINELLNYQEPPEIKYPYLLRGSDSVILASNLTLLADTSQLTLDSVSVALDRDFTLTHGKLYVYNDVVFTGTNKFSYASPQPMYINSFSNLYLDSGTTFSYSPDYTRPHTSDQRSLINMSDKTSTITFNNCSIDLPDYGMQLTKGTVIFDNKVTINGNTTDVDTAHSFELGNGTADNDVAVKVLSGGWVDINGYLYHHPA